MNADKTRILIEQKQPENQPQIYADKNGSESLRKGLANRQFLYDSDPFFLCRSVALFCLISKSAFVRVNLWPIR